MRRQRTLWISILLLLIAIGSFGAGMLYTAARAAAQRMQCSGQLCQINVALHNYHEENGCLPPAYIAGPDGTPMHSWRILILKYIEPDMYDAYDFNEPWNGPNNIRLAKSASARLFRCPAGSQPDSAYTNYVAIVGPHTAFPKTQSVSFQQMPDPRVPGKRDTLLVAEIANSDIWWTEPRDLEVEQMSFQINDDMRPSISSHHEGGVNAMMRGGCSGRWFPESTSPELIRSLVIVRPD